MWIFKLRNLYKKAQIILSKLCKFLENETVCLITTVLSEITVPCRLGFTSG